MKIIHVSSCDVLVDEKKTLQRHVVIVYHHMKHSMTVKLIHRAY